MVAIGVDQQGDDKPWIGLAFRPLRLSDDPPLEAARPVPLAWLLDVQK
jgi:hypothetical protein